MAMIEIRNLSKIYGAGESEVIALKDISMNIEEGEFVSVMGTSGSGKSTLLHLMGGLDYPTDGQIFFEGKDIFGWSDTELSGFRLKNIGFVFQAYNLLPELSVRDNILLPFALSGERADENAFRETVERFGLKGRLNHLPSELSGGQRQRVAIARAVIRKPKLLLCDEPSGNLDKHNGEILLDFLEKINQEKGVTIIMITHDLEAAKHCERMVRLEDGVIV